MKANGIKALKKDLDIRSTNSQNMLDSSKTVSEMVMEK